MIHWLCKLDVQTVHLPMDVNFTRNPGVHTCFHPYAGCKNSLDS